TMSSLVKRRDQALGVDISNDTADRVLSGGIRNSELLSKIGKDGPKQPKDVSNDNEDAILVSKIGYGELIFERGASQNNNLILAEIIQILCERL
ncbi:MAG: hypothetical protein Q9198_006138, partial [Flavoplaca austrocitrina]